MDGSVYGLKAGLKRSLLRPRRSKNCSRGWRREARGPTANPPTRCTVPPCDAHNPSMRCTRRALACGCRFNACAGSAQQQGDWRQGASAHLLQHANEVAQREAIVAHHACKSKWRLGLVGERWGCRGCSHACERRWRLGLLGGAPAALVRACRSQAHDAMEPSRQQGQPATPTQTPRL